LSCESPSPDANTEPKLEIQHFAGTIPDPEWNFLPYPAHYGQIQGYHVLLLSKAQKVGKSRSIRPVGMLTIKSDSDIENWIIANDAHEDYQITELSSINDLMTNHNGIKSTLERWITNRKGIGRVQLQGWKDAPSLMNSNNQ